VHSYTEPPASLLQYREWLLKRTDGTEQPVTVIETQGAGRALRVRLQGIDDRTAAEQLRGSEILLERAALPAVREGEYYLEDLVGCTVRNTEGLVLGRLTHFLDAPAGSLMVVRGERERWLPATAPCLRRVDVLRREVLVDWPADF